MLGRASKEIRDNADIYSWKVNGKNHLMFGRGLVESDIDYLKGFLPFGFYYAEEGNLDFLRKHFKVKREKSYAIEIDIENIDLSGKRYKNIRNAINKAGKYGIEFFDNYKKIEDVEIFIDRWEDTSGENKFRSFANKNIYFFENNLHIGCINLFGYIGDKLISFGVLSNREYSAYIIGKALCYDYPGLSEYTDLKLYEKARGSGVKMVNLSGGTNRVVFYKKKMQNTTGVLEFDGKVIDVI